MLKKKKRQNSKEAILLCSDLVKLLKYKEQRENMKSEWVVTDCF